MHACKIYLFIYSIEGNCVFNKNETSIGAYTDTSGEFFMNYRQI